MASFCCITLPFYFYDPQGFSPLHVSNKLTRFNDILPAAHLLVPSCTVVCALVLSLMSNIWKTEQLFLRMAGVLSLPFISAVILHTWQGGRVNFMEFGWYGLSAGLFAISSITISISKLNCDDIGNNEKKY
jgi:hypothetical protein